MHHICLSKLFTFAFSFLDNVFFTTSVLTASFNFFKSIGTLFNLPTSESSTFGFKSFKPIGTLTNLLMSSLSTSAFKAIKSFLAAKLDVSTPVACSNFFLMV